MIFFSFKFKQKQDSGDNFSRFFLDASSGEQKKIIVEAARRANDRQRKVYYRKGAVEAG